MQTDRAPLVGIWVAGVSNTWHPFTVAAAMAFYACASKRRCKTLAPDGSFLLLIFPAGTGTRHPDLFEASVDAPQGLPLLPRSISLDVPAGGPPGPRTGDAAASKIPSPHANSAPQEMRAATLVERPTLTHCLLHGGNAPAAAAPAACCSAEEGSGKVSPTVVAGSVPGGPPVTMGTRTSVATWQSDPPLSAVPVNCGVEEPAAAVAMPEVSAIGDGSSGRSSSMSQAASRVMSRNALATWSREFAPQGPRAISSMRADTPMGAAAAAAGPPGHSQHLVTPRLQSMQPPAPYVPQGAGLPGAAAAPRGGMPAVPEPSPMVADSLKGYTAQGRLGAGQAAAAPTVGVPGSTVRWGPQPAASVTGAGPLSLGSLPPVASTPSQFTGAVAPVGAGHAAVGNERTTAATGAATLPPVTTGRVTGAMDVPAGAGGAANCHSSVTAALPGSGLPPGMPEWLTSAVGRHPELAVLLERSNAEQASDCTAPAPGQAHEGKSASEPAVGPLQRDGGGGGETGQLDGLRAAIKRQRDSDENQRGGEVEGGGTAPGDDEDTAALAALLDGDGDREEPNAQRLALASLHAALAPGGMSEAELAAMATRSPSHASPAQRATLCAETFDTAAVPHNEQNSGEGAVEMVSAPAASSAHGDQGECQVGTALEPRHLRGPSEPHRAIKSPRVGLADRAGGRGHGQPFQDGGAIGSADVQVQGVAVGVPALGVPQAAQMAQATVMHAGVPEPLPHLMPMPVLQCSDPEAAAALAPLYAYISRLQRHIEVLQTQLRSGNGHVPACVPPPVPMLQAGAVPTGHSGGPFPDAPCVSMHGGRVEPPAPDSPPAMQPAGVATANIASSPVAPQQAHVTRDATARSGPGSVYASPVQNAFKVTRASRCNPAVSPSVEHPVVRDHAADGASVRESRAGQRPAQHTQGQRELRADVLGDSLEAAAANFLAPGRDAAQHAPSDGASGKCDHEGWGGPHTRSGGGQAGGVPAAPHVQGTARLHEGHAHEQSRAGTGSERSQIRASWPAPHDPARPEAVSRSASRAPSRQLTGALFGGSPDKVFSTDELKAAVAAAEAAAEASTAPTSSSRPLGRADLSEDAADEIVDSFLVASHSPARGGGRVDGDRVRATKARESLSFKQGDSTRAPLAVAAFAAGVHHSGLDEIAGHTCEGSHVPPPAHRRHWDGRDSQGSPRPLLHRRPQRHEGGSARAGGERAPMPLAAAASAVDTSSVCPETEAPSTPAALSHGRAHGGSTTSVAARMDHPVRGGRSPGCVPVRPRDQTTTVAAAERCAACTLVMYPAPCRCHCDTERTWTGHGRTLCQLFKLRVPCGRLREQTARCAVVQEPVAVGAAAGERGGATCLSPELAALIADAAVEHCTSGAAAGSRALVRVAPDTEAHMAAGGGSSHHGLPPRTVVVSQHSAMAGRPHSMYGGASEGGFVADVGARWPTSALGALPTAVPLSQHRPGASRVLQDIPRIKFPETKAGRQIQRLCGPDLTMLCTLAVDCVAAVS